MKTIIPLETSKISDLIFLSSRAIHSSEDRPIVPIDMIDSHYQFETTLYSLDPRIRSYNFKWGSSEDYFLSFRLFHFTTWIHKRILKRVRYRLQRLRIIEKMTKLQAELNSIETEPDS